MRMKAARTRRGTILVSVLWIMIFLGFLAVVLRVQMTGVVASVRVTEDKALARILAEAGLSQAAAWIRAGPPEGADRLDDRMASTIVLPAGEAFALATNEAVRIDLNTAGRPLIVGALRAAGAAPAAAEDLATRIVGRRGAPPNAQPDGQPKGQPGGQQAGSAPPPAGSEATLLRTVAELAALPGMTPAVAIAAEPYVTVSSGLAGVRLEALDDTLLRQIPGLPPSVRRAIGDFRAGRLSRQRLDQALAGAPFNTLQQAPSWRVEIRTTLTSGYSESFEVLMLVSAADEAPYRVLDWRRAAAGPD